MESQKKSNPWLVHVAKYRKDNPSLSYKDVLKEAKMSYTKKVSGSAISGGGAKKEKKPRAKKGGSIVGGSVSGGSVVGGSSKTEKKPRKTRKDKGTKKEKGGLLGENGHGQQKVPIQHVTAELVKQV